MMLQRSVKKLAEESLDKLWIQNEFPMNTVLMYSFIVFYYIYWHKFNSYCFCLCAKVYSEFDGGLGIFGEKSGWPQRIRRVSRNTICKFHENILCLTSKSKEKQEILFRFLHCLPLFHGNLAHFPSKNLISIMHQDVSC